MKKVTGLLAKLETRQMESGVPAPPDAAGEAEGYADRALASLVAHSVPKFRATFQPDQHYPDYRCKEYADLIDGLSPYMARWRTGVTLLKVQMRGGEPTCYYEVPYNIAGLAHRPCFVALSISMQNGMWVPSQADAYPKQSAERSAVGWQDIRIPVPKSAWTFYYAERSLYDTLETVYDMRAGKK